MTTGIDPSKAVRDVASTYRNQLAPTMAFSRCMLSFPVDQQTRLYLAILFLMFFFLHIARYTSRKQNITRR